MRPVSSFVLLMAGLIPLAAGAAPWSSVARNAESVVEIDIGSLARKGQTVKAWSRQVYNDDQDLPLGDPPFRAVRYLYTYECGKRSALLVRRTYVDEQGEAIKDQMLEGLELAKDVIPGTLQERVYDYACKNAKDPDKVAQKPVQVAKAEPGEAAAKAAQGEDEPGDTPDQEDQQAEAADDAAQGESAAAAKGSHSKAAAGKDKAGSKQAGGKAASHKAADASQGEADAEAAEDAEAKPAKRAGKAKPKAAKDEDAEGHAQEDDGQGKSAHKSTKSAMLEKKGKHDLDEECDNCEKAESAPKDEKAAKPAHGPHWSYEGKDGPQNWAKLSPEFAPCGSGKFQSPIDIREGIRLNLDPIKFEYKSSPLRILDNGHTVQVNYGMGSSIWVNGEKYSLVQFHFHKPSEERIEGKSFDMVVHLVHKNMMGQLAVVAVMLRNGAPNPLVQTLWTHLPLQSGKEGMPKNVSIDANQLLPQDRAYYTFLGSLTTPPCSEGVLWLVMKTPMQVSRAQIAAFGRLYENNARPVQQANRRLIKESL